eukprot:CAMPEP_0175275938 /NCGR_PEP_ID=MMETSP0093-20121207/48228_1 /TAXON_ID=311494 /ORGANISM="Alexandrium monilatum, Strain CCMP3105" /LENGTH=67 /DNA_ID=CAMNT_0016570833 /DNA_START=10 /DNA_END=211 /DNA_ORIENTATION=+
MRSAPPRRERAQTASPLDPQQTKATKASAAAAYDWTLDALRPDRVQGRLAGNVAAVGVRRRAADPAA